MGIKAALSKPFAAWVVKGINKWKYNAVKAQDETLHSLLKTAAYTTFGKDHQFSQIKNYQDFKANVPIREYEDLRPYIDRVVAGESDVLWKGKPLYFAKTSGTTSGVKYIPLSKESMPEHIKAARNALLTYINETGKAGFVNGKMIFLQGSPILTKKNGINVGRLSGIVAHLVPAWVQMYFDKLSEKSSHQKIKAIFKNFSLFVYGGVNYEPYRAKIEASIGRKIDSIETYPASEGFIAYQDSHIL